MDDLIARIGAGLTGSAVLGTAGTFILGFPVGTGIGVIGGFPIGFFGGPAVANIYQGIQKVYGDVKSFFSKWTPEAVTKSVEENIVDPVTKPIKDVKEKVEEKISDVTEKVSGIKEKIEEKISDIGKTVSNIPTIITQKITSETPKIELPQLPSMPTIVIPSMPQIPSPTGISSNVLGLGLLGLGIGLIIVGLVV
jgi:hypothetical protein